MIDASVKLLGYGSRINLCPADLQGCRHRPHAKLFLPPKAKLLLLYEPLSQFVLLIALGLYTLEQKESGLTSLDQALGMKSYMNWATDRIP